MEMESPRCYMRAFFIGIHCLLTYLKLDIKEVSSIGLS